MDSVPQAVEAESSTGRYDSQRKQTTNSVHTGTASHRVDRKKPAAIQRTRVQGFAPDCDPANMSQPSSNLFMEGSFLHPRYNLECTFVRRCIVSAMSNSIPNQVEADSTGSTMAGPISAANANPETEPDAASTRPTPLAEALKHAHPQPLRQYRGAESVSSFSNSNRRIGRATECHRRLRSWMASPHPLYRRRSRPLAERHGHKFRRQPGRECGLLCFRAQRPGSHSR